MKNNDEKPIYILPTFRCKLLAQLLQYTLMFGSITVAFLALYFYDWFIALVGFLFSYIVLGIIRSKIRLVTLHPTQFEENFSDKELAILYISKYFC